MNDNRNSSALFRRNEQLKRWMQSSTNKQSTESKRPSRIKFSRETVFLAACKSNDKEEIKELVNAGVDVNTGNTDGLTALHQACIDGNLDMVEYLIDLGAAVNVADSEGWTPLHATASCGFVSVARYLIEMGASNSAVNYDGDLPIDTAGGDDMIQLLQNDINAKGINVDECRAVEKNNLLKDLDVWASKGIQDMDNNSIGGATPLHVAAAKGYFEVVEGLIKKCKVNVDAIDSEGWTPLHAAAHFSQRQVAELLIQNGADMEITNAAGLNCIEVADPDLVQWLHEKMAAYIASIMTNKTNKRPPLAIRDSPNIKLKRVERTSGEIIQEDPKQALEISKTDPVYDASNQLQLSSPSLNLSSMNADKTYKDDSTLWTNLPKIRKNVIISDNKDNLITMRDTTGENNISTRRRVLSGETDKGLHDSHEEIRNAQPSVVSTVRSFVPPVRDEESEAQRKAHAKRARETRRSTQGVTLDELKSAEQLVKVKKASTNNGSPVTPLSSVRSNGTPTMNNVLEKNERVGESDASNCVAVTLPLNNHTTISATATIATGGNERRPSWRLRVDAGSKFALEDATKPTATEEPPDHSYLPKLGSATISRRSPVTVNSIPPDLPTTSTASIPTESAKTTLLHTTSPSKSTPNASISSTTISMMSSMPSVTSTVSASSKTPVTSTDASFTLSLPRQTSTESNDGSINNSEKVLVNDDKEHSPEYNRTSTGKVSVRRRRLKRRSTGVNQVDIDDVSYTRNGDSELSGTDGDDNTVSNRVGDAADEGEDMPDYKALWEASLLDVKALQEELLDARSTIETLNHQMNQNSISELEKREKRAMERKLSEMEEELKGISLENKKLADENSALIRVVAKLSK